MEVRNPQLAEDIRTIVEPHTAVDPEFKSQRRYSNLTAAEVRDALKTTKGYQEKDLPAERTMRNILNRMNYRLKRIQKGKPLKKTKETDAIFANVKAVQQEARSDPETLEISVDTKAKVKVGDYVRGGKARTDSTGKVVKGSDHDPPPKEKWVPFGVLMVVSGLLVLVFGNSAETSDFWADGLVLWWNLVGAGYPTIKRLVIYLDNGPSSSGRRRQWLKRMVQLADWSGLEIRLVYYPPYHSKYNRVERCWSSLEKKWNGTLLNCWEAIRDGALRMTWYGEHPVVKQLLGKYEKKVRVSAKEWKEYESRLQRSATLPIYDITIKPEIARGR
jgi:transposase